ncbi:MAG: 8-oxo-dGTP diphosphatase [Gammaproteobacteria bacterium]|nr:8-oxo-dGTP diphosphatase [Gammaproteobacteria bacterium]
MISTPLCGLIPVNWAPQNRATLVYVVVDASVLLIKKLRGHGAGKVNAPGGKIEPGETAEECAARELYEEVGLYAVDMELGATLRFLDSGNGYSMEGLVFVSQGAAGTPKTTPEAVPFWCTVDQIPYAQMWEDDRFWLPHVLAGSYVRGDFLFDHDKLKEWYLERDGGV